MRSLLLLDTIVQQLSSPDSSCKLSSITTDPSTNVIYAISETGSSDGTTELAVLVANGNEVDLLFLRGKASEVDCIDHGLGRG